MTSISIECKEAKIEPSYSNRLIIEVDKVSSISGDVNDILSNIDNEDLAKYKNISSVIQEMDVDDVFKAVNDESIIEYVSDNPDLIQKILDNIDEKYIIGKARKIKIEKFIEK